MALQMPTRKAGTSEIQGGQPQPTQTPRPYGDANDPWLQYYNDYGIDGERMWSGLDRNNARDTGYAMDRSIAYGTSDNAKRSRESQTPLWNLRFQLRENAMDSRMGLEGQKGEAAGLLKREARGAVDTGVGNIRKGMNQRGMLYSGLREGEETGLRTRAASALARQIADSNSELTAANDEKQRGAAATDLAGAREAMVRQQELDRTRIANQIARQQQMQQLAATGMYGVGQMANRQAPQQPPSGAYNVRREPGAY